MLSVARECLGFLLLLLFCFVLFCFVLFLKKKLGKGRITGTIGMEHRSKEGEGQVVPVERVMYVLGAIRRDLKKMAQWVGGMISEVVLVTHFFLSLIHI